MLVETQIKQFMTNLSNFYSLEKTRFWQNLRSKQILLICLKGPMLETLGMLELNSQLWHHDYFDNVWHFKNSDWAQRTLAIIVTLVLTTHVIVRCQEDSLWGINKLVQ